MFLSLSLSLNTLFKSFGLETKSKSYISIEMKHKNIKWRICIYHDIIF